MLDNCSVKPVALTDMASVKTVGKELRRYRESAGLLQDQVAMAARARGLNWTAATVAAIETDRRELSLAEFLVLRGSFIGDEELAVFFRWAKGTRKGSIAPEAAVHLEAERKAARKLGVTPEEIVRISRAMWGKTLTEERDAQVKASIGIGGIVEFTDRLRRHPKTAEQRGKERDHERALRDKGVITGQRMVQARRGHVTRSLLADLREALSKGKKK
jgi:transcriptional regulator with XRE-family HTH domain